MAILKRSVVAVASLVMVSTLPLASVTLAASGTLPDMVLETKTYAAKSSSLAGKKGRVRGWHRVPDYSTCGKLKKRHVASSRHSAYAATTGTRFDASICAVGFHRSSRAGAEAAALATCRRGLKRYKVGASNNCVIFMSK